MNSSIVLKLKKELEEKNRELAIESALERVRTVAMAMKYPADMLDICRVISKELEGLGVKGIRNIQTAIINEEKAVYLNYEYFRLHKKNAVTTISYKGHQATNTFVRKILKDPEGFFTKSFKKPEIREWVKYQAKSGQYIDEHLKKASSLHYYFYSIGPGALGISTYAPLNKDEINLFKRFRNVFKLSYQRFIDIQKAEAQARKAQIEAALERVRGKALAMHKSEELHGVVTALKSELIGLDIPNVIAATIYLEQDDGSIRIVDLTTGGAEDPDYHLKLDKVFRLETTDPKLWVRRMFKNTKKYFVEETDEDDFKRVVRWLDSVDPAEAKKAKKILREKKINKVWLPTVKLEKGRMNIDLLQPPTSEIEQIMLKLGAGFDLAYRRFLDLQKAEAQTRESKIELGLERVRARAMAMHKSDEVMDVAGTLFEELQKLNFSFGASSIIIMDKKSGDAEYWIAGFSKNQFPESYPVKYFRHPYHDTLLSAWKKGEKYLVYNLKGKEKKTYDEVLFSKTGYRNIPKVEKQLMKGISSVTFSIAFMKHGALHWGPSALDGEQAKVLQRFAQVFEQAYTRFLDLQKAESQAREARIEAALEKVRARAMAMQRSDELEELITTVYGELTKLDLVLDRCFITIFDPVTKSSTWWMAAPETRARVMGLSMHYHEYPPYLAYLKAWEQRKINWVYILEGDIKKKWDNYVFKNTEFSLLPPQVIKNMRSQPKVFLNGSFNAFGCLSLATLQPLTEEQFNLMTRFARVFDLTYTRFNDLKQAEAQAREARIQLALERVQARAMAMQKSAELSEAAQILYQELRKLNLKTITCGYMFIHEHDNKQTGWFVNPGGTMIPGFIDFPLKGDEVLDARYNDWKSGKPIHVLELKGKANRDHHKFLAPFVPGFIVEDVFSKVPDPVVFHCANFSEGYLLLMAAEVFSAEEQQILIRFAKVFEVTYTRFLDLQKAEANARESKIEASLERVRAKAMSMHSSEELVDTISTFYHEIEMLSVTPRRCGVAIMDKDTKIAELATMNTTEEGESRVVMGHIKMEGHRILDEAFKHWLKQKEYHATLRGNEIKEYYKVLRPQIDFPDYPHDEVQYGYYFMFKEGDVYAWTDKPLTEEQLKIYRRFTTVLSLTFKRYNDLKHAEEQAREANIEVALERVRAKALAMQQPEELGDVARVLRNEMGALGVEELETASIYIYDKDPGLVECWYALKDPANKRKKMVTDQFQLNPDETWVGREMKKFYLSGEKQTSILMQGSKRKEWVEYCYSHSPAFKGFYGGEIPDRTYHLYKFSHGYLGAAAPGDLSVESWKLLSRAASVFSLAYSRFKDLTQARNDLHQLKEEKQRAESALKDLRSTQTQLIQSEKMASLGELTAGIAHEIQNPLNFVNNFSELSNELIAEMKDELVKGNNDVAMEIVESVKQNLEKINFHGKRADAIVKSMLQHSRSSTGQKEFTDINALADEYLRLAYHGFRVKDPSFNAKFETRLDEDLEKIKLVPQEIGRVILNLINNAFYAVSEKKKENGPGYEPFVVVSTLKNNDHIEIKVRDNGNGIPPHVKEKIFQPFFTTKPTGQGTGLGLSLSYDIITKGHGGELKVNTKEGEGTEFVIRLPVE